MTSRKVTRCIELLEGAYGIPESNGWDPVDLLVTTILSQNTTDVNSLRAFGLLKAAFPSHEELVRASPEDIAEKIRVGGLAEIKSIRIKDALRKIEKDAGFIDLSFLAGMSKDQALEYLQSLPGVGPKTASVVLLFAFNFPAMPVDTHVYRVSRRVGLVPENASINETQRLLEKITPPEKYLSLHLNLIELGRRVCKARSPLHDQCPLAEICDYYHGAATLK